AEPTFHDVPLSGAVGWVPPGSSELWTVNGSNVYHYREEADAAVVLSQQFTLGMSGSAIWAAGTDRVYVGGDVWPSGVNCTWYPDRRISALASYDGEEWHIMQFEPGESVSWLQGAPELDQERPLWLWAGSNDGPKLVHRLSTEGDGGIGPSLFS